MLKIDKNGKSFHVVSFDCNKSERWFIDKIVKRAIKEIRSIGRLYRQHQTDLQMVIAATHCNGCHLDLKKLIDFDEFNFAHDILGMEACIDTESGQLGNHFLPRCSRPE